MMKKTLIKVGLFSIIAGIAFNGCTDRDIAKIRAYGGTAHIKCYSGNKLIYDGYSTGKVFSEDQSDGFSFVDKKDNKLTKVSGNCIIKYINY
jgi:hypothetical protein